MSIVLRYGTASQIELDPAPEGLIAVCEARAGRAIDDPAAEIQAALSEPLDFPPLAQAAIPGDRVAVVLDDGLPQVASLVAGVVRALLQTRVEPAGISIVRTAAGAGPGAEDPAAQLAPEVVQAIDWVVHDPSQAEGLAYLATSDADEAIYLNRKVCEADLVLPIALQRAKGALAYRGVFSGLFPALSDEKTIHRFARPVSQASAGDRKRLQHETDQAAWLLGIQLIVQIVPGPDGSIYHILAGNTDATASRALELYEATWRHTVDYRAQLVVASIDGGPSAQTWQNLGRALASASRVVSEDGAIALCTDLELPPGPAVARLGKASSLESALGQLRKDISPDARVAIKLAEALERGPVYLLSRLDDEVVEGLGLAPVADISEMARLIRRRESCILLPSAQYVLPKVEG